MPVSQSCFLYSWVVVVFWCYRLPQNIHLASNKIFKRHGGVAYANTCRVSLQGEHNECRWTTVKGKQWTLLKSSLLGFVISNLANPKARATPPF